VIESPTTDGATSPPGRHHHQPLSRLLIDLLAEDRPGSPLTLNHLLLRSEGRGIYLFLILLCLPFLQPLPLMGLSTPLGLLMMILAIRHALALPSRLPRRLGDRPLPDMFKHTILPGSSRFLKRLEKWVKPRRDRWLASAPSRVVHCSLIAILGLLLALPLPPFVVFSNVVPGFALVVICLSMMEEDGMLIWLGYLGVLGNIVYFGVLGASAGLIIRHWKDWLDMLKSWL
jgi:hypothetical protein